MTSADSRIPAGQRVDLALGRDLRRVPVRRARRRRGGVPAAPRPRPPHSRRSDQLPRQHRCAEARRRHRHRVACRPAARCARTCAPGHFRARRPVHRPHLRAREELLRRPASSRTSRWRIRSARGWPTRIARRRAAARHRLRSAAAPTSPWRARNSRRLAEVELYRSWGCDVIGMTNMPEAKLAREAELCYATVAMVTDFDCWHPTTTTSTSQTVIEGDARRTPSKARGCSARDAAPISRPTHEPCPHGCDRALGQALMTAPGRARSRVVQEARRRGRPGARTATNHISPRRDRRRLDRSGTASSHAMKLRSARSRTIPSRASCSATSPRCSAPARFRARGRCAGRAATPGEDRQGGRHRGARLHPRRRGRPSALGAASCRCASRASCRQDDRPSTTRSSTASTAIEIHVDAIAPGERVLVVDDLIATGGTADRRRRAARADRAARWSAACFVIDLPDLGGAAKLRARRASRCTRCCIRGRLSP